jgi:phenylacetate-CoA ligase
MAFDGARWLYDHLPPALQNTACTAAGVARLRARYGPGQRSWQRFFERSGGWSDAELREYRRQRLREVLRHAYEHVPFHRQRFLEAGVVPDEIRDVDDLARLPLLDKGDVVRAGRGMLADDVDPRSLHVHTTSGSTGTPLTLYRSADAVHALYGFGWARLRSGLGFRDPYASFAGAGIVPAGVHRPPFWRTNAAANQRLYSVFHLREDHLVDYAQALQEQELAYIEGYPAPVFLIADWIERQGFRFTNRLQAVFPPPRSCGPGTGRPWSGSSEPASGTSTPRPRPADPSPSGVVGTCTRIWTTASSSCCRWDARAGWCAPRSSAPPCTTWPGR